MLGCVPPACTLAVSGQGWNCPISAHDAGASLLHDPSSRRKAEGTFSACNLEAPGLDLRMSLPGGPPR